VRQRAVVHTSAVARGPGHLAERDLGVALQQAGPRAREAAVHLEDPVADRERLRGHALAADATGGGIGRRAVGLGEGGAVGRCEDAGRAVSDEGAGEEVGLARAGVGDAEGHVDDDHLDAPALGGLGFDSGDVGCDERVDEPVVIKRDCDPAALVGVYSEDDHGATASPVGSSGSEHRRA
jgi:hypothetical protein